MTTLREEKREEEVLPAAPDPGILCPQARAHASSVPLPSKTSLQAVTERVRQAGDLASKAAGLLDKPGALAHSQPPSFRQARDRHHECAEHFSSAVLRGARLAWGYWHLLVKAVLNGLEWVLESPLRFAVAALIVTVIFVI
jgi:hypothetical protein